MRAGELKNHIMSNYLPARSVIREEISSAGYRICSAAKLIKYMKKIALLLIFAMGAAFSSLARDTELSVSYGASPAMNHLGAYRNDWNGLDGWGALNLTIDHRFAPALWIGLNYTYSSADSDHAWDGRYGKVVWHGVMVNVRYEWYQRAGLKLYSHVGIGALVEYYCPSWKPDYNHTNMAFQLSPVGVEYDVIPAVGLFAEAGYGCQGVAKVGIRVGF